MKTIQKDELFQSLSDFLKVKGVELKDGQYAHRIRQVCNLLGDAINATQRTAKKARDEVDKKLDQLRQTIHETTAPRPPSTARAAKKAATGTRGRKRTRTAPKPAARKRKSSRQK